MPKVKLEIPYLDLLPQPPDAVKEALWHWEQYLRFLPPAGPPKVAIVARTDREHLTLTRQLQEELSANTPNIRKIAELQAALADLERRESIAPDEAKGYDYFLGQEIENVFLPALGDLRRSIFKMAWYEHRHIHTILSKHGIREQEFIDHMNAAYNQLAGDIAVRNLRK